MAPIVCAWVVFFASHVAGAAMTQPTSGNFQSITNRQRHLSGQTLRTSNSKRPWQWINRPYSDLYEWLSDQFYWIEELVLHEVVQEKWHTIGRAFEHGLRKSRRWSMPVRLSLFFIQIKGSWQTLHSLWAYSFCQAAGYRIQLLQVRFLPEAELWLGI